MSLSRELLLTASQEEKSRGDMLAPERVKSPIPRASLINEV